MRVIILALVLANVLFFMWSTWVAEPPVEALQQQVEGTAELRLMSELDDAPLASAVVADGSERAPDLPASEAESALAPMLEVAEVQAEAPAAEAGPEPEPALVQLTDAADTDNAAPLEPADGQSDVAGASEPGSAQRLPPAPELPAGGEALAGLPVEAAGAIQVAAADVEARCASLGPYLNLREATEAASRLRAAGLAPRQRLSEEQVWVGHWVYLPSYADRDEAVEVVERLRAKGVKDIYIEPRGDRENAVSLGLFSDRENAELYAGQVRQYEVRPQITDRYRFGSAYWVDITLPADTPFDLAAYQRDAVRKVRLEEGSCSRRQAAESDAVD